MPGFCAQLLNFPNPLFPKVLIPPLSPFKHPKISSAWPFYGWSQCCIAIYTKFSNINVAFCLNTCIDNGCKSNVSNECGFYFAWVEFPVTRLNGLAGRHGRSRNGWRVSSVEESNSGLEKLVSQSLKKRKVFEHIWLLKAKDSLSDEEEKDMLDFLYTSQYQMRGIVAISLGRIIDPYTDGFTHAVYIRFQQKEDLQKFYLISSAGVLKEHVMPYCHGLVSVDFESEVEDDILAIFRKGEDFNYGVEFILLFSALESALGEHVKVAMDTLTNLTIQFGSSIVQATQGSNINANDREYTHAAVIRFPSCKFCLLLETSLGFHMPNAEYSWKLQGLGFL